MAKFNMSAKALKERAEVAEANQFVEQSPVWIRKGEVQTVFRPSEAQWFIGRNGWHGSQAGWIAFPEIDNSPIKGKKSLLEKDQDLVVVRHEAISDWTSEDGKYSIQKGAICFRYCLATKADIKAAEKFA